MSHGAHAVEHEVEHRPSVRSGSPSLELHSQRSVSAPRSLATTPYTRCNTFSEVASVRIIKRWCDECPKNRIPFDGHRGSCGRAHDCTRPQPDHQKLLALRGTSTHAPRRRARSMAGRDGSEVSNGVDPLPPQPGQRNNK